MDVPFLLSRAQMRRIEPFFPLSHGIPRVDDRRIVSGIAMPLDLAFNLLSLTRIKQGSFRKGCLWG